MGQVYILRVWLRGLAWGWGAPMVHGAALGKLGWTERHTPVLFCDLDSAVFFVLQRYSPCAALLRKELAAAMLLWLFAQYTLLLPSSPLRLARVCECVCLPHSRLTGSCWSDTAVRGRPARCRDSGGYRSPPGCRFVARYTEIEASFVKAGRSQTLN